MDYSQLNDVVSSEKVVSDIINNFDVTRKKHEEYTNGYASLMYNQISTEIKAFEESLDEKHEVGVRLVSYGQSITFYLSEIGYQNPYLIFFYGYLEDGSPIQLIQHVSQLSFVLIKSKKLPDRPKTKIGFM